MATDVAGAAGLPRPGGRRSPRLVRLNFSVSEMIIKVKPTVRIAKHGSSNGDKFVISILSG